MRRRWRFALAGVVIASMALGIYLRTASREPLATQIPEAAIRQLFATRLNDSNGKPQPILQWRGKTLVINFWATWCPPCREEMPAFSRLQTKYAANGVEFVGIALDTPDNVIAFLKQIPVSYPLLLAESEGMELTQQLGNSRLALPYTVVLGPNEKPRLIRLGKVPEQELDDLLGKITHLN
jgi:thiol-disulfide isomerase/thioredoxin